MKTPETDNLARGNHVVPTEWAEQLERERDEARKLAEAFHLDQVSLLRERDEAREERDELKDALLIMENLLKPGIELFPEIGEILKRGGTK